MSTSYKIKQCSLVVGTAIGVGVCIVAALGLSAAVAELVLSEKIAEGSIGFVALGILFLSGLTGSLIAAKLVGRMPAIVCATVAGAFFLVLVGGNMLFLDGQLGGIGGGLLTLLASYGVVCLLSLQKGKRKRKYKKMRSR